MITLIKKSRFIDWFNRHQVEIGLCAAMTVLAGVYLLVPRLRESIQSLCFVPVVVSALLLGWKKASAFTVLGVSLILCITFSSWADQTAKDFFQLVIWGCTLGTTSAVIGLIVFTKDRQVFNLLRKQNALAMTDQLTQIANRRAFDTELRRKMSEFKRHRITLSVLMVDIDYFKKFNDQYGHGIGDVVLQTIARTIEDCLRDADLVARFGGEEFAVMLPNTNMDEAGFVAERIRSSVDQIAESDVNCPEKVSVSIGVAEADTNDSIAAILERADIAMYQAKRKGRNRVSIKGFGEGISLHETHSCKETTDEIISSVYDEGQSNCETVDSVTGLTFAQIFESELGRRMYEAARYGMDICLGIVQLKRNKVIEVTKADFRAQISGVGRSINKSLRASDLVTWYSQYEFGIMLPFTKIEEGTLVMQRIFWDISTEMYQNGLNSLLHVDKLRVIQLDGCETKIQALSKLKNADAIEISESTVSW